MSSLRAVLPSGEVISVSNVKPISEKIINFNGSRRRIVEDARDMKKEANGLRIRRSGEPTIMFAGNEVIIGNLRNEQVQEIIRQFAEKEYYDFSQFEYQKADRMEDLKLGEKYLPYNSENNPMLSAASPCSPFNGLGVQGFGQGTFDSEPSSDETYYDEEGNEVEED